MDRVGGHIIKLFGQKEGDERWGLFVGDSKHERDGHSVCESEFGP